MRHSTLKQLWLTRHKHEIIEKRGKGRGGKEGREGRVVIGLVDERALAKLWDIRGRNGRSTVDKKMYIL